MRRDLFSELNDIKMDRWFRWHADEPQPANNSFRPTPRKSWLQRLVDWWCGRPS